jgi:hypothetical protein
LRPPHNIIGDELKAELLSAYAEYSGAFVRSSRFIKIALVIGGATLATCALAVDIGREKGEISSWTILGLVGAVLVAIGSIFDALREREASRAILIADKALDEAQKRKQELDQLIREQTQFDGAVTRGLDLYNSMDVMRGVIEQSLDLSNVPVETIIQNCLSAASNSLLGAFDFAVKEIWTICVFMAQKDRESGKVILRGIAHLRAIPCELSAARTWPEGVGVAGIAYSTKHELIIKDMSSDEAVAMFNLRDLGRAYDHERYASIAAVPITIGSNINPWGVAVATSDQAYHFSPEPSYGVGTVEPLRAIASMTALAAKASEAAATWRPAASAASEAGDGKPSSSSQ